MDTHPAARRSLVHGLAKALGYLAIAVAILLFGISLFFHIETMRFQRRASAVTQSLGRLRIGQSSGKTAAGTAQALGFQPAASDSCSVRHCLYTLSISNAPHSGLAWHIARGLLDLTVTRKVAYWIGVRFWVFNAAIETGQEELQAMQYSLGIMEHLYGMELYVSVKSIGPASPGANHLDLGNPDFQVKQYPRYSDRAVSVRFTSRAPTARVEQAFDLRLNCLSQLAGCNKAATLLPRVFESN